MKRKIIGILTVLCVAAASVPITADTEGSSGEILLEGSSFNELSLDPFQDNETEAENIVPEISEEIIDIIPEEVSQETAENAPGAFETGSEDVSADPFRQDSEEAFGNAPETEAEMTSEIILEADSEMASGNTFAADSEMASGNAPEADSEMTSGNASADKDKRASEEGAPAGSEPASDDSGIKEHDMEEAGKLNPDLTGAEKKDDSAIPGRGFLVFDTFLPDGTPNYIWVGEGSPFYTAGEEAEISAASLDDHSDLLSDSFSAAEDMFSDGSFPALYSADDVYPAGMGTNYYNDPVPQPSWHSSKGKSATVDPSIPDGVRREGSLARIYQGGQYFIDGGVAINGVKYYADPDGYLWSGWLKALSKDSEEGIDSPKSDEFVYRYYDPSTFQLATGLCTVDGLPHYFDPSSGVLLKERVVDVNGTFYFSDRYAICGPVKLAFGNIISGNNDHNNDAFLAYNQVTAVDAATFKGQDGSYSFRPKWYTGKTSIDVFGFAPSRLGSHLYCTLHDDSLKGRIGVIYRNVGKYRGRDIDLRLTITDYTFLDLNGSEEVGYFYIFTSSIGLNCTNLKDITANMQFLDHETQQPVTVKGYATFCDIDIGQSIQILSPVDEIFVDSGCQLYKDPNSLTFTSKFIYPREGNVINDPDKEYWVQVNYHSDHLTYRFGNSYDQYVFADTGLVVNGASWYVWKDGYTRSVLDYSLFNKSTNTLRQSWQGLYFRRLGMVSVPPVTKLVSDSDEILKEENTLRKEDEVFTYTLAHNVPGESDSYFYSSYVMTDTVPESLSVIPDSLRVLLDDDTDVTDRFTPSVSGQTVTFTADPSWLSAEDFYDNNYNYQFRVRIRDGFDLSPYKKSGYQVVNKGSVSVQRQGSTETVESNEVVTHLYFPSISVQKTDAENGRNLSDAGFTLYPYSKKAGGYAEEGEALIYDAAAERYLSGGLALTEDNDVDGNGNHRFLLKETTVPRGYADESWQQEITVTARDQIISILAVNTPDTLPVGEIRITKRILEADIWWPHGNPTFLFRAEGLDEKGEAHRYEEFICFRQQEYTVDQNGYATLTRVIPNVPLGTYQIYELPVMDYYLTGAAADTSNVSIVKVGEPAKNKDPLDTAYGTAALTRDAPEAGITFTDQKGDYRWYRHTDVVENVIPIIVN